MTFALLHRWSVSVAHDAYAANLCSCSEISTLSLQDSNATIMSGHMNRPSLVEGSCLSVDKKLFETPDAVTEMVGQKLWPWLGCRWRWCRGCLADTGTDSMDGTFTASVVSKGLMGHVFFCSLVMIGTVHTVPGWWPVQHLFYADQSQQTFFFPPLRATCFWVFASGLQIRMFMT